MLMDLFGPPAEWPDQDLIAASHEFDPAITIAAYCSGAFPMPCFPADVDDMCWWSPIERGIIDLNAFQPSRSLRKSMRRYTTTIDADFEAVIVACASLKRPGAWLTDQIIDVYLDLHRHGYAHSVETWTPTGELVGGLYGVAINGFFAGESMFHDPAEGTDSSKVALARLIDVLKARNDPATLLDVQWVTNHLATLGAREVSRETYLTLLDAALECPETIWPDDRGRHA